MKYLIKFPEIEEACCPILGESILDSAVAWEMELALQLSSVMRRPKPMGMDHIGL